MVVWIHTHTHTHCKFIISAYFEHIHCFHSHCSRGECGERLLDEVRTVAELRVAPKRGR